MTDERKPKDDDGIERTEPRPAPQSPPQGPPPPPPPPR